MSRPGSEHQKGRSVNLVSARFLVGGGRREHRAGSRWYRVPGDLARGCVVGQPVEWTVGILVGYNQSNDTDGFIEDKVNGVMADILTGGSVPEAMAEMRQGLRGHRG